MSPQVPAYLVMAVITTCFARQEVIAQPIPPHSYPAQGSGHFGEALLALLPFSYLYVLGSIFCLTS